MEGSKRKEVCEYNAPSCEIETCIIQEAIQQEADDYVVHFYFEDSSAEGRVLVQRALSYFAAKNKRFNCPTTQLITNSLDLDLLGLGGDKDINNPYEVVLKSAKQIGYFCHYIREVWDPTHGHVFISIDNSKFFLVV